MCEIIKTLQNYKYIFILPLYPMKIFALPVKTAIQIVICGIVIGALVIRDYPKVGLYWIVCCVAAYLLFVARRRCAFLLHFRKNIKEKKILVVSWIGLLCVWIGMLWSGNVRYFLLLLFLAVDYWFYDKRNSTK